MRVFQGEIESILDPDNSKTQPHTREESSDRNAYAIFHLGFHVSFSSKLRLGRLQCCSGKMSICNCCEF